MAFLSARGGKLKKRVGYRIKTPSLRLGQLVESGMNYELQSPRSPLQRIRMRMQLLELKLLMPYLSSLLPLVSLFG